jgi:hypothetical protein
MSDAAAAKAKSIIHAGAIESVRGLRATVPLVLQVGQTKRRVVDARRATLLASRGLLTCLLGLRACMHVSRARRTPMSAWSGATWRFSASLRRRVAARPPSKRRPAQVCPSTPALQRYTACPSLRHCARRVALARSGLSLAERARARLRHSGRLPACRGGAPEPQRCRHRSAEAASQHKHVRRGPLGAIARAFVWGASAVQCNNSRRGVRAQSGRTALEVAREVGSADCERLLELAEVHATLAAGMAPRQCG